MQVSSIILLLVTFACSAKPCLLHQQHVDDPTHASPDPGNFSHEARPGHELLKRWFGVKTLPSEGGIPPPYYYPWPATCTSPKVQPVRYCWRDERSATNLQGVIDAAVSAWAHALQPVSSLTVMLEPTCHGRQKCLCTDEGVAQDALMISDETRDGDDDWNQGPDCITASTIGYRYIPDRQPNVPYRHYSIESPDLKICSLAEDYWWGTFPLAVRDIKHELGHVFGLQHEHQRPDRNHFIWFKCKNLKGYDEAYEKANIDENGWFDNEDDSDDEMDMKEKMSRICNHQFYAERFFPAALEFIRASIDHMDNPDSQAIAGNMVKSDAFDYESIMIYDANLMSKDKAGKKYVLFKRGPNGGIGDPVWMGGGVNGNPETTQVSAGDIARIAMLYNSGTAENAAAQDTSWGPVRVKIRDRSDVIVPAPRKRDEL